MSENKKTIELKLLGNAFSVIADNNEDYIREISSFVNNQLNTILEKNPHTNRMQIAILGCMNIAEMLFDAKREAVEAERAQHEEVKKTDAIAEKLQNAQNEINRLGDIIATFEQEKSQLNAEIAEKEELLNQYREHLKEAKQESESNRKSILGLQNQLFESQIELSKAKENQ